MSVVYLGTNVIEEMRYIYSATKYKLKKHQQLRLKVRYNDRYMQVMSKAQKSMQIHAYMRIYEYIQLHVTRGCIHAGAGAGVWCCSGGMYVGVCGVVGCCVGGAPNRLIVVLLE